MANKILPQEPLEKQEDLSEKETELLDPKSLKEFESDEIVADRPQEKSPGPLSGARGLILGMLLG
ncbi:MAG: hypothetical protein F6K35_40240, partial [Okeania sp. SIO2H7]|nr:hypothetical protein [Okeania sp. SIO2H7]